MLNLWVLLKTLIVCCVSGKFQRHSGVSVRMEEFALHFVIKIKTGIA